MGRSEAIRAALTHFAA
ncbi:MAG: hypothetical protein WAW82_03995 [Candidatus Lutibacillus vidarii]